MITQHQLRRPVKQMLRRLGLVLHWYRPGYFHEDRLATWNQTAFLEDPEFQAALSRGEQASPRHPKIRWRLHVVLWAAKQAARLPGNFAECGVNTGFLMTAVMHHLNWNSLGKHAWLFDTFEGLDPALVTSEEATDGRLSLYKDTIIDAVKRSFAEYEQVHFVQGSVPASLEGADTGPIAFLSIDMNNAAPEIAAFRHFWPQMVPGGYVVLDDYNYEGYPVQHRAFDALADELGFEILSLPTGQGLIQKPAHPVASLEVSTT
ncbi:MAG: TylF/MycF/NovP-related O-methyltransferase [Pseudomonadota bacterium]